MRLTRFIDTRIFAILMCLTGLIAMGVAYLTGQPQELHETEGLFPWSPDRWISSPGWSAVTAMGLSVIAYAVILIINRTYNFVRDTSHLPAAMFMILQGCAAVSTSHFGGGYLALMVTLVSTVLLLSIYQQPWETRRVFAVFTMLGAGILTSYGFIPFIIVYAIGCIQMRVMSPRAIIAMIAGLATPLWIVLGLGIMSPESIEWPELSNPFAGWLSQHPTPLLVMVGITLVAGLVCGVMNMMTVYTRNAKTRSINGLMSCTGIMAGIMCVADFPNLEFYLPVLNMVTAYQTSLYYRLNRSKAAYVSILSLAGLYAAIYLWSLWQV